MVLCFFLAKLSFLKGQENSIISELRFMATEL